MSAYHPSIARRASRESDEPYLYESFTRAYDNEEGQYSRQDCLRLAKQIGTTDMSKIPLSCQDVVKQEMAQRKAWEGASVKDRAQQAIASRSGSIGHHQMQRRLTRITDKQQGR